MSSLLRVALMGGLAWLTLTNVAIAGPLENLERERAFFVGLITDVGLPPDIRQQRLGASAARLRDLERIVINSDELLGRNTPTVRRAFATFELTFLVHAAAEEGRSPVEHWFASVGLDTPALVDASVGRR